MFCLSDIVIAQGRYRPQERFLKENSLNNSSKNAKEERGLYIQKYRRRD